MKTFLLATLEYPPHKGGIATYLQALVRRLPQGSTMVVAPHDPDSRDTDMESDAPIYRRALLSRLIHPRWLLAWLQVDRIWRRYRPEMLLVSHLLPMGTVARLMKRFRRVPYTVIVHGMDVASSMHGGGRKRREAIRVLADASAIVANSGFTAELVRAAGVPKEKIWIVRPSPGFGPEHAPSPERIAAMRTAIGFGKDVFGVLALGRHVRRKGFDDLIHAVSMLAAEGRKISLCVAGDGPDSPRLHALAEKFGARGSIHFPGRIPDDELPTLYAACDVFAMTPRSEGPDVEGFGIVYLEANVMGKPVIGSRAGGVPEAVADGVSGLLVVPGSARAIADALRKLMDDRDLAARLGAQGRERVIREFADDRQLASLAAHLTAL